VLPKIKSTVDGVRGSCRSIKFCAWADCVGRPFDGLVIVGPVTVQKRKTDSAIKASEATSVGHRNR
jgi:hypothetical protein